MIEGLRHGEEVLSEFIVAALPHMPRELVGVVARRYIAGETLVQALQVSRNLGRQGFATTMDILGEDTNTMGQAEAAADAYVNLIEKMAKAEVERNVSLKLTQFGLRIDKAAAFDQLKRILAAAAKHDFFVRIDMEDSSITDTTLDFYRRALAIWPRTGTVLQARLKRTVDDARELADLGANIRLCKGIYKEPAHIAHTENRAICDAYIESARHLLNNKAYVGLATHDKKLIDALESDIVKKGAQKEHFEFQALLGVPIRGVLERLKAKGIKVRLYVPYGSEWYAYSIRRLKENPQVAMTIAMSLLNPDRIETL
jgi:proline dehydrogenase